jgi:hypothetical protein
VDPAERRRDAHHRLDELVHVFGVYEYRHGRDAGELVVEDSLALHDRHRGHGPDISQAQNARPVRADRDAAPDHGQLARQRRVLDYGLARPRHPRCVHVAHVLHRPHRVGGLDHEFPALVLQKSPVTRPQYPDAVQLVQHPCDPLGLVAVLDLERDLAHRGLASDVDGRDVPDEAATLGYRSRDRGQLARAVRNLDTIRIVERHGEPPNVPDCPSLIIPPQDGN